MDTTTLTELVEQSVKQIVNKRLDEELVKIETEAKKKLDLKLNELKTDARKQANALTLKILQKMNINGISVEFKL